VIILLFMPIVKRKKKIFSPKMRKSGTCFAQMPLLRNYYYYNTIILFSNENVPRCAANFSR